MKRLLMIALSLTLTGCTVEQQRALVPLAVDAATAYGTDRLERHLQKHYPVYQSLKVYGDK